MSKVFDVPLLGVFKLLHFMLVILGFALISAGRTLQKIQSQQEEFNGGTQQTQQNPLYDVVRLNKRWRAERNLWLSAFAFTMWTVLAIFYREMVRRLRIEDRLAEFEVSDVTMDTTTRDISASYREVTSKPAQGNMFTPRKSPVTMSPVKETGPKVADVMEGSPPLGGAEADTGDRIGTQMEKKDV